MPRIPRSGSRLPPTLQITKCTLGSSLSLLSQFSPPTSCPPVIPSYPTVDHSQPEIRPLMVAIPEYHPVMAAIPESHPVMAAIPESRPVMAAKSEPSAKMAAAPEPPDKMKASFFPEL
ncbi:hypothetical protein DPX16_0523 [Anabarilius grahami]|uniref:Uncharacterized protein n=1 Tax=Anabarilius grahami TaxID=495550 RepID=A0A3N0XHW6_ANAGA|nr:hypothetical protein DPX16_0523 [Anabarilius grahami]